MRWILVAAVLGACGPPDAATVGRGIVYGADDREEPDQAGEPWLSLARERTVALARAPQLDADGRWIGPLLGDRAELCRDERFLDQTAVAGCSGVLLDAQTVLTAGHCLSDGCEGLSIVHDYGVDADGARAVHVSSCLALVRQRRFARLDYALLTLAQPIDGVTIAPIGTATVGQAVVAIGHPLGLPAKVDQGGAIADLDDTAFTTDLDLYEGSSGSGVFARDGTLLGIASRGQSDFVFDPRAACLRTRTSTGGQELIIRADAILADTQDRAQPPLDVPGGCQSVEGAPGVWSLGLWLLLGGRRGARAMASRSRSRPTHSRD